MVTEMREMKDSGIPWIGTIPGNWNIVRVKEQSVLKTGKTPPTSVSDWFDGHCAWYTPGDFHNSFDLGFSQRTLSEKAKMDNVCIVLPKDSVLIIGIGGTAGKVAYANIECSCNQQITALIPVCVNSRFLMYCMISSSEHLKNTALYTTLPIINNQFLGNWHFAIPSDIKMQQLIASFLDAKCAEIDALSADIQAEIDTLEAYKRSVITETVTKGLDRSVPMKDSGIPWVGGIPATWAVHPVYYFFDERKNKNYALQEQNLLSLSYGKIVRKDIDTAGGLLPASFTTYNIVEAGDIIIRPTDLQNDKRSLRTGLVTEKGIITSAYIDLAPRKGVRSAYFHYLLHSFDVQKVFYNMGNGVRQGLNYSEFSKLMVFAPPVEEQDSIVAYLDKTCAEIDSIIAQKREQLAVLADYKKSIIYEYVTGKKEVV